MKAVFAVVASFVTILAYANVNLRDKEVTAPNGKIVELLVVDAKVADTSLPDGMYRLSDGRLVKIRSSRVVAIQASPKHGVR